MRTEGQLSTEGILGAIFGGICAIAALATLCQIASRRHREHSTPNQAENGETEALPILSQSFIGLPRKNPNFTGREDALTALHSALVETHEVSITQPQAITGLGGIGKTQLAIEYAHRYEDQYGLIGWIHAEEEETLVADLFALVRAMGLALEPTTPPDEMLAHLHTALASREGWLLVLDNAENRSKLRKYVPPTGTGHVIITSRNPNWRSIARTVDLTSFDRSESIEFLLKRTERTEENGADAVADAVGDLPLALEQAGAYMEQTKMSFAQYAKLFVERHQDLWEDQEPPDQYHGTVATTWEISLEKLQGQTPECVALLELSSFLAPEEIPLFLLLQGAGKLRKSLAKVASDEVALREALSHLRQFGLIEISEEGYSVHRLVQAVVRDRLDAKSRTKWLDSAVELLAEVHDFKHDDPSSWLVCVKLLPHVAAATGHVESSGIIPERVAYLLNDAGLCLRNLANFSLARQYFERALKIDEAIYGPDHHTVATLVNNLGGVLQALGKLEEAKEALERALKIMEMTLGPKHPSTEIVRSNLAALKDGA